MAQRTAVAVRASAGSRNKRPVAKKSGPPRAGARRGDATRQVILDAAEQCLAAGDFDGVSLRTISEAAGVDIALVNYHFGSKESLVEEVTERRARDVHDARVLALEEARHKAGTAPRTSTQLSQRFWSRGSKEFPAATLAGKTTIGCFAD